MVPSLGGTGTYSPSGPFALLTKFITFHQSAIYVLLKINENIDKIVGAFIRGDLLPDQRRCPGIGKSPYHSPNVPRTLPELVSILRIFG